MWQSVANTFPGYTAHLEGYIPFMYADILGKVTTAAGVLIDSPGEAMKLPWHTPSGALATSQQVTDAWNAVKARTDLYRAGGKKFANVTNLRLTNQEIDEINTERLYAFEHVLKGYFPDWDNWPADAQLATLSMAWGLGPYFPPEWPRFTAFMRQGNFAGAAAESHMDDRANAGLVERNDADKQMLINASKVVAQGRPLDQFLDTSFLVQGARPSSPSWPAPPSPLPSQPAPGSLARPAPAGGGFITALGIVGLAAGTYYLFAHWKKVPHPLKILHGTSLAQNALQLWGRF